MFNFTFEKTANEIVAAAQKKVVALQSKITEREVRIQKQREEHKITDAVLIDLQNQMRAQEKRGSDREKMSYTSNVREGADDTHEEITIGAGVINFLLTEQDHMDGEKSQVERLKLIIRNLKDVTVHTGNGPHVAHPKLSYEELKYLGF